MKGNLPTLENFSPQNISAIRYYGICTWINTYDPLPFNSMIIARVHNKEESI